MKTEITLNKAEKKKVLAFAKKEHDLRNAYISGWHTNYKPDDLSFVAFVVEVTNDVRTIDVKMNVFLPDRRCSFASRC